MNELSPTVIRDIAVVLWFGVVSFASPCFLPVVPVFVGYITGQTAQADQPPRRWFAVGQAVAFMVAFTLVFGSLWGLVGLIGWAVGGAKIYLRILGGIVVVLLGLHTAQFIRIGLLDRVLRVDYAPDAAKPPSLRRSLVLGLAFGAGWTPCIGPVLAAVLGLATTRDSVGQGLVLLLVYALGLGLPFILVCAGAGALVDKLAWFTAHQRGVNIVVGLLMIVVGFLMIANLFERLASLIPGII